MNNGKERHDQQHHKLQYWATCMVAWMYYKKEISSPYTLLHRGCMNYGVNRMAVVVTETLNMQHLLFLDFNLAREESGGCK